MLNRGKIFIAYPNKSPKFGIDLYDNNAATNYSKYLDNENSKGHYQTPITTSDLIDIMKVLYKNYDYVLSNKGIQFVKDETDYCDFINNAISNHEFNQLKLNIIIINKIIKLYKEDKIEIQQINMVNYKIDNFMYIQNSGTICCSDKKPYVKLSKIILKVLNND